MAVQNQSSVDTNIQFSPDYSAQLTALLSLMITHLSMQTFPPLRFIILNIMSRFTELLEAHLVPATAADWPLFMFDEAKMDAEDEQSGFCLSMLPIRVSITFSSGCAIIIGH